MIDGLLVPGADYHLDPALYGQKATREYTDHNPERVEFDFLMMQAMLTKNKPVLGICAGLQLMAVKFANGTMIQHIPTSTWQKDIHHKQDSLNIPMSQPSHDINIEPNSKLANIFGSLKTEVNSHHEQAVENINSDEFIISARANDNIIEAIEHKFHPFFIGVEWHPEYLVNKNDYLLLTAFLNSSSKSKKHDK
jgi:putative glutamine amidotransferase